jgi:excisionase family DNA binding protein
MAGGDCGADSERLAPMLTVQDVAGILKCSARTVYRLVDAGRMPPPCRLGALVRWPAAAIESWVADGCPGANVRRRGR